jgi:hypothetical protein
MCRRLTPDERNVGKSCQFCQTVNQSGAHTADARGGAAHNCRMDGKKLDNDVMAIGSAALD